MHIASQALAIERQASAQSALAQRVSKPKTRAILGLMRLNFLSVLLKRILEHQKGIEHIGIKMGTSAQTHDFD